jgi:hypothetical protein
MMRRLHRVTTIERKVVRRIESSQKRKMLDWWNPSRLGVVLVGARVAPVRRHVGGRAHHPSDP